MIARGPKLLRHLDDTLSDRFTEVATARWDCRLGRQVTALSGDGSGGRGGGSGHSGIALPFNSYSHF